MTMPANALITEADLESLLQVSLATALAELLIGIASQQIESITNRKLIAQDYTLQKYTVVNTSHYLYLRNYPINSISKLAEYDSQADTELYSYTENTDYLIYADEGYVYFWSRMPLGHHHVRVSYNAGWAIASIPYDLKLACAQLAGLYYTTKMKSGVLSESIGDYSITFDKNNMGTAGLPIPPEVYNTILKYKRDII